MAEAELRGLITGDADDFIRASEKAQDSLGDLGKEGRRANTVLQSTLGGTGSRSVFGGLSASLSKVGTLAKSVGGALASGLKVAAGVAKNVALGVTAISVALVGIGGAAVANFAKFQQSFSQVRTLIDESQVNVERLSQGVRDLSVGFGVDVVEATEAAYQAISAGQDPARVVDFLKIAFEGAAAGAASTVDTVNLLTSALNTFESQGLSAEQASDILFTTVRLGKTTITELASSFGQVGPLAAAANVSFSELGAALATTTAAGLSTAEAATAIKAAIAGIVNPSKDAAGALASIGVSADSLAEEGLVRTFERIAEATDGNVAALTRFLPNIRAVNAAAILAGNGLDKFRKAALETADASGAASEAFEKTANGITRQFAILRQTLTDTFRTLGESLTPVVGALTKVFSEFATESRQEVTALARVIDSRLAQAEAAINDFGEEVQGSGGAITIALEAVSDILDILSATIIKVSGPIGTLSASFQLINQAIRIGPLVSLSLLTTAFSVLLEIVSFIPKQLLEAAAALARFAGLSGVAASLDEVRTTIEATSDAASELSSDLRSQLVDAVEGAVVGIDKFGERSAATTRTLLDTATAVRGAAGDVRDFAEEVEDARREVRAEEFEQLGEDVKKTGDAASTAADAIRDLGDAAGEAAPKLEGASVAGSSLSESLRAIAGDSAQAARGLAELGPRAQEISKAIGEIGTAQTDEQALATRQETVLKLIEAADAALSKATLDARNRGKAQLAEARAAVTEAERVARGAAGTEGFGEAQQGVVEAQGRLEQTVLRVNEAFNAEREVAREAFESVKKDIAGLDDALEVFRETSIAKASAAGRATIEEARAAFEAEEDRLRVARGRGEIQSEEFLSGIADAEQRLTDTITRAGDQFVRARELAREAFDLGEQTQNVSRLADALDGEFAAAVAQARIDAEQFGFSQTELNEALGRIIEQSSAAGDAFEGLGDAGKMAGEQVKQGADAIAQSGLSGEEILNRVEESAKSLGLTSAQTKEALDELARIGIDRVTESGGDLGETIIDLATRGLPQLASAVTDLGEKLDEDGRENLADLNEEFLEGKLSLDAYGDGLAALADDAKLTGAELRNLVGEINAASAAAEAASQSAAAASRRRAAGSRSGGETQSEVNQRFGGGFQFGIQSSRPPTVESTFNSLTPAQRNQVRQQAREAGVTSDEEFTRFVVEGSPNLDPGGLSFDLGGVAAQDQMARIMGGERVLTRNQNSGLESLLSGFFGRRGAAASQTINVSPTFNITGANESNLRQTARALLPEISRAVQLGVTGKGLL